MQDIRLALRRMRRNPLFAISVVGTLALGVAATTAIYTVVDGVLLKPLPFPDPAALVRVTSDYTALDLPDVGLSQPELQDYALRSGAFEAIAGIWPVTANLTGSDRPERVETLLASANYFDVLGATPALGRTFTMRDEIPGIATVAVISDGLWRRGFGGDPGVLGRTLRIDEDVYEIIGVMPASFRHPSQTLETDVDVWAPSGWRDAPFSKPSYSARFMPSAIGRVARGLSVDEARARIENLSREIARDHPDQYPVRLGWTPRMYPLADDLVSTVRPGLLVLMAGIAFVMLIAISNISNLLLIRAVAREREIAVQRALGASRWRIIATVLIEGAVLALIGGALGFLASLWGVDLLLRLVPDRLPRVADIAVDHRVFFFAMLTAALAGLLVAIGPALQSARTDVSDHLRSSGKGVHSGARARVRNILVVAQVAIALVLLAGAGLLVRSLWRLQSVQTGIATDEVLTLRVWLPQPNEPSAGPYFEHPKRVALIRGILERLGASHDVRAAGVATALPAVRDTGSTAFAVEGWTPDQRDLATATPMAVTAGYFPALGVRLVQGRLLEDRDDDRTPRAAVINDTLVRTCFRTEDPVGRRFRFVNGRGQASPTAPWITIVGVVADVKEDGLDAPVRPQIYQSLFQSSTLALAIVARGHGAPPPASAIEQAVQSVDPNLPLYAVRTGEDLIAAQLAQRRFATRLINAFAMMAVLLAAFGLHGIIAYGVRQRTHEIGVRIALGATAARIVRLVLGQAVRLAAGGVVVGLAGAFVLSQFLRTMLFEISPTDPRTLIATVGILIAVVGLATIGAAHRATRIEARSRFGKSRILSAGPLVRWSAGPLVRWSAGPVLSVWLPPSGGSSAPGAAFRLNGGSHEELVQS